MSFRVTANCSMLVVNINNIGLLRNTEYFIIVSALTGSITSLILMQWINRWYKLPVTRGWREHCRCFCYMWTRNCAQIFSLNFKLFLELLNVFIWWTLLSFSTSLLAHCWKFTETSGSFFCMGVSVFLWALGADRPWSGRLGTGWPWL